MFYTYGDLCIKKEKLHNFLESMDKREYTTFDILQEYQGEIKRNENISVGDSWNAHFGKILNMCAESNCGIIENVQKGVKIDVDHGPTTTAIWRIL